MRLGTIFIALTLALLASAIAQQAGAVDEEASPTAQPEMKLPEIAQRQKEYFDKIGTGRGTGFRQYMRYEALLRPRVYPSGDLVNFTSMAWFEHFRMQRSPEFSLRREIAAAVGIGNGKWRPVEATQAPVADVGRINVLAFNPSAPATVYAGTPAGGLWRTLDDGANWQVLTEKLPMIGVTDIAIDPQKPQTIYILTGDGEGGELNHGAPSMGIVKSVDDGMNWQETGMIWRSDEPVYGHRLAIHPTSPAILFAATEAGLYRTTDGATLWSRVAPDVQNPFWDVMFHPTDPTIVYAATKNEVYRSTDTGQTWTQLIGGLPVTKDFSPRLTSNRIRLAVSPASPDRLYVLYGSRSGFWIGLYRSDDRGNTFTKQSSSNPPPAPEDANVPAVFDLSKPNILHESNNFQSQSDYDLALAVAPDNADRVHIGALDTWRSDDGGKTWKQTSRWRSSSGVRDYTHADVHALAYRGTSLFAGTDGGVFRSNDAGERWASIASFKSGVGIAQIYSMCITPANPNLMFYGAQDNGTWKLQVNGRLSQVNGGDGFVCQIDPTDSNIVYSSLYFGDIFKATDGGAGRNSWQKLSIPTAGTGAWLTPYTLGPDPTNIYACYKDLWLGTNRGFAWKNLTNGSLGASNECTAVVVAPSDPQTIYVTKQAEWDSWHAPRRGDPRPPFFGGGGVFRTTNGGTTWQTVTGTLPLADAAVTSIAVSPTDPLRAWVTFSGYKAVSKVFGTVDGGRTWSNLSAGLPNLPVNTVAALNAPTHGVFIGLDVGVYYRDDRLDTWVAFDDDLPRTVINSLVIDEPRHRIFAATFGRGIWQSDIPPQ